MACVISQTVVDPSDPAFGHPTKFIGTSYAKDEAQALAARLGWTVAADGPRWRRVVASPRPRGLAEIDTVRSLVDTAALSAMTFPAGSIGPRVEACIRFVTASGHPAAIGALTDAAAILAGRAGTTISAARSIDVVVPDGRPGDRRGCRDGASGG